MQMVLEGVSKKVGAQTWLYPMTLALQSGAVTVLLGATQAGKTSLMRVMAGLDAPSTGRVMVGDEDVTGVPVRKRDVAMVYQQFINYPSMTVARNIASPLLLRKESNIDQRVQEIAARLHIDMFLDRLPAELSGGQQQRVALARALARRPPLVLLDEPLAALDSGLRERTGLELRALQRRLGASFVMVTHDQAEALSLADRVAVLEQGRIAQVAPPRELYQRPATRSLARFLGAANVLEAGRFALQADSAAPAYALRPERIRIVAALPAVNSTTARVTDIAFRGGDALVLAEAGGETLRLVLPGGVALPEVGVEVFLAWDSAALAPLTA